MGNNFTISVVDEEESVAQTHIQTAIDEIRRIEQLFTTFKSDSQTNLINENAGIQPVMVDKEVYDLIERSIAISKITQGAFDISYGSIDKSLWNFDKTMKFPDFYSPTFAPVFGVNLFRVARVYRQQMFHYDYR